MKWLQLAVAIVASLAGGIAFSQEDPGRTPIGRVSVTVYHATNGDPQAAGKKTVKVSELTEKRLRSEERLRFSHYRLLGQDVQPLLRSYESWAQPLKPSDEVLVRFEARSRPTPKSTALDLELWLSRKKVLKMDVRLQGDLPLFILGPEWRGGRLIIGVALAPLKNPGS